MQHFFFKFHTHTQLLKFTFTTFCIIFHRKFRTFRKMRNFHAEIRAPNENETLLFSETPGTYNIYENANEPATAETTRGPKGRNTEINKFHIHEHALIPNSLLISGSERRTSRQIRHYIDLCNARDRCANIISRRIACVYVLCEL